VSPLAEPWQYAASMSEALFILADDRGVLRISGPDARSFLQGLVSNDVTRVTAEHAIYAALLTPQGKFLHDFFILERDGALCLDGEAARLADLQRRLSLYKLRSKVTIAPAPELAVALLYGDGATARLDLPLEPGAAKAIGDTTVFVDPRLAELGARAVLPRDGAAAVLAGLGFAAGAIAVQMPLMIIESLGMKSFGSFYGITSIFFTAGAAVSPVITGRVFDQTGSYSVVIATFAVMFMACAFAISGCRTLGREQVQFSLQPREVAA